MTTRRWTVICALCAVLGGIVDHYAARRPQVERLAIQDRTTDLRTSAYVGHTRTTTQTATRWKIRETIRPGGIIYRETEAAQDVTQATATSTSATEREQHTEVRDLVRSTTPTSTPPRWLLTAGAGASIDRRPAYLAGAQLRILGPLWIGALVHYQDHPTAILTASLAY